MRRRKQSALYSRLLLDLCASRGAVWMNSPDVMMQAAAAAEETRGWMLPLSSGMMLPLVVWVSRLLLSGPDSGEEETGESGQ